MKDTRQNLDRAIDLLEEVRSQCRSLKAQASRAERFRKLQDEFSRMQSVSLGLRYQELQVKFRDSELKLAQMRSQEAETASQMAAAEKAVSRARQQLVGHESDAQIIQDQLREAERKRAALQQQAERMAGERRLLAERKITLQSRIDDAGRQQLELGELAARAATQLAEQNDGVLQAQKTDAAAAVEQSHQQYLQAGQGRDTLLAEYERLRQSSEQADLQKRKAEQALLRLDHREQQLNARLAEVQEQIINQKSAASQADEALAAARKNIQQHESDLGSAQQQLDVCRSERESAMNALSEKETGLRELKGLVQELRGRSKNQDVSNALRDALRAKGAIWMDELLDVPEGLEAAVAAALRGRSADVRLPVDPDQQTLAQAADSPIALFAVGTPVTVGASGSLSDALGLQAGHPLFDVFAPVLLIDDIKDAAGENCCVSRDGWRYEPSGWLIPPAGNRGAERIATQRQLRASETRMSQAEAALTQARVHFNQAEAALENQQALWQQAHLNAARSESGKHAAEALVARLQAEANALQERESRLQSDLNDVIEERGHWQSQIDAAGDVDVARISEAKKQLDEQNTRLGSAEQALNQARSQLAQAEQALALFAQARDNLSREHERLLLEQDKLNAQQNADAERLQQEGVTFTHAFTPMTHCYPARASLMTGMYPSKHGIHNNVQNDSAFQRDLNPGCETFSEKLKEDGYKLAYAGKWHVSAERDPSDFGWEELDICSTGTYGRLDSDVYLDLPRENSSERARGEVACPGYKNRPMYGVQGKTMEDTRDYRFLLSALHKLDEYGNGRDPWCLFVSLTGPHGPFVIPEKYANMYAPEDIELPVNFRDDMANRPAYYGRLQKKYAQLSVDEARESIAKLRHRSIPPFARYHQPECGSLPPVSTEPIRGGSTPRPRYSVSHDPGPACP